MMVEYKHTSDAEEGAKQSECNNDIEKSTPIANYNACKGAETNSAYTHNKPSTSAMCFERLVVLFYKYVMTRIHYIEYSP